LAMQSIRTTYAYNYKHDDVSLKVILTELAKADSSLKDAPPPGTATANSVADIIEQLKTMTGDVLREQYNKDDTVSDYDTESAYGATTDNSRIETKSRKSKRNKSGRKAKDKDKADSKEKKTTTKNNCPHCKKFNQRRPHPNVPTEKCFWNKKYKGYPPERYVTNWRSISNPKANSLPN